MAYDTLDIDRECTELSIDVDRSVGIDCTIGYGTPQADGSGASLVKYLVKWVPKSAELNILLLDFVSFYVSTPLSKDTPSSRV